MSNERRKSTTRKSNKSSHRRLKHYLVDLIVKSLLVASLLAIDFSLFLQAGSYSAFDMNQVLEPEVKWVYLSIVAISFAIMFLLSFSQTLQNILIGVSASFLLLALFNQFALFSPEAILLSYIPQLDGILGEIVSSYSHFILAAFLAIIVAIILTYMQRKTQLYLLIIINIICICTLIGAYTNPTSRNFIEKQSVGNESTHPNGYNLVYIALNNASNHRHFKEFDTKKLKSDIKQAKDNMLGFYQKNNFTYYPNSYLKYVGQPYLNLVTTLNSASNDSLDELLLSDIISTTYWDFKSLKNEKLYLRQNTLFDTYHKKDYNIRVYQQDGIELCNINNKLAVNRCIEKVGIPIDFGSIHLPLESKVSLLAAQWIESTGLLPGIDPILGVISAFNRNIFPLHFSTQKLGSYDAFASLNRIADDIEKDKGNNLYFTIIDIPGNLFLYDHLCSIKPISRWIDGDDKTINEVDKYVAYSEQTSCLYGQLEDFMQKLQSSGKLKQTSIIIQGLNTAFAALPGSTKDMLKNIQNTKQAGFAIYNHNNPQFNIDNRFCSSSSLLNGFINSNKECSELEDLALTDNMKNDIKKQSKKQQVTTQEIESAVASFKNWYKFWAAQNQVANNNDTNIIPIEKQPTTDKEIKDVPVFEVVDELPPEEATKPIVANTSQSTKNIDQVKTSENATVESQDIKAHSGTKPSITEETNTDVLDMDKPEQLKKEFKEQQVGSIDSPAPTAPSVNVEVKVIDKTEESNNPPSALIEIQKSSPQN